MECPNCGVPFESTSLFLTYTNKWGTDTGRISVEKTNSFYSAEKKLVKKATDVCFGGDESDYRWATTGSYVGMDKLPKGWNKLIGEYGSLREDPSLWIDVCTKCNATGEIYSDLNEYFSAIEKMSKKIDSLAKKKAKASEKKRAAAAAKKKKQKEAEKKKLKKRLKELEKE